MRSIRKLFGSGHHHKKKYTINGTSTSRSSSQLAFSETSSLSSDMDQHTILPKANEIAETVFEKVSDTAAAGYGKVSDAASDASNVAKSAIGKMGDVAHSAYEATVDTAKAAEDKTSAAAESLFGSVADTAKTAEEKAAKAADHMFESASGGAKAAHDQSMGAVHAASDLLGDTIHLVEDKAEGAYDNVTGAARNAYGAATGTAENLYGGALQGAYNTVTGATHEVVGDVRQGAHEAYGAVSGAAEAAKQKAEEAAEKAKESVEAAYGAGVDVAQKAAGKGHDMLGSIERKVEDEYDQLADAAHTNFDSTAKTVGGAASGMYGAASDTMKGAGDKAAEMTHGALDSTKGAGESIGGTVQGMFGSAYGAVKTETDSVAGTVQVGAHEAAEKLKGAGESGVEKLKDTAAAAAAAAQSHRDDFDMFDPLKKAGGEQHPSDVQATDLGYSGSDSFQDSIRSEVAGVHDQIDSLIQAMHEDARNVQPEDARNVQPEDSTESSKSFGEKLGLKPDTADMYGRGSSPDETTFDRKGPLTIPAAAQQQKTEDDLRVQLDDEREGERGFNGMAPRPPTPPKELDDEDVKPTTIDVGVRPKASVVSEHPRSILKHSTPGPWFDFKTMDPTVLDLIYWRDPKKSGIVLGAIVILLLIFANYPLISVLSYLGLAVLGGTLGFRLYKIAEAQLKKTDGANPFQPYLEKELNVPEDRVHQQVDVLVENGRAVVNQLRRLFLVENIADSAKFGLLLWALTYVGSWFSGLCILLLVVLGVFTIPKVYETYQEPIDHYLDMAKKSVDNCTKTLEEKVPILKKLTGGGVAAHEKSN